MSRLLPTFLQGWGGVWFRRRLGSHGRRSPYRVTSALVKLVGRVACTEMSFHVARLVESLVTKGTFVGLRAGMDQLVTLEVETRCELLVAVLTFEQTPRPCRSNTRYSLQRG